MGSLSRQMQRRREHARKRFGSRFTEVDARDIRANPAFAGVGPFEAVYPPDQWIRLNAEVVDAGEEVLTDAVAHAMRQLDGMVRETFGVHIARAEDRAARVAAFLAEGQGNAARTFELLLDWANRRLVDMNLPAEVSDENLAWARRAPLCP